MSAITGMIQQAIRRGFTARTILQFITQRFPQYSNAITQATAMGYAANTILKHIVDPKGKDQSDPDAYLTDSEKTDKLDRNRTRKAAIGLGAGILGATGLAALGSRAAISGGFQPQPMPINPPPNTPLLPGGMTPTPGQPPNPPPAMPQTPGQMATPQTPMPQGITPGQAIQQGVQNPIAQAMQPQGGDQIAQAASAIPKPEQTQPASIFEQLTQGVDLNSLDEPKKNQLGFLSMISDQLESQGKTLKDPEFKKLAKKIKDTIAGKPGTVLEEITRQINPTAKPSEPEPQEMPKIEKSSIVSAPQGIGEVKSISGDKAIVEIDGKAQKINLSDIEPPPLPEKDLAELHKELIAGIEKSTGKQVSRNVNWAGYDPEAKELQYRPWSGDSYTFTDIDPEDIEMLTNFLTQRKTTGENFIGGWEEGTESPIGAAMHKLITKLKEKAKEKGVKEYSRKYQTVYSAYEPAERAAKLKKKLAEQEERKKKKDEKKSKK